LNVPRAAISEEDEEDLRAGEEDGSIKISRGMTIRAIRELIK
jgi:hypothetical protein